MHNNNNYQCKNVLEQGPDFWCWFDKTQFSCHCVHAIHACKDVYNPNVTFQSNCAEGLHFSAFRSKINHGSSECHCIAVNLDYRITSNLSDVSNYSDSVMNYLFTSNSIVQVNNLEYFLL